MDHENDPPIFADESGDDAKSSRVIQKVDRQQLQHFVAEIKSAEQQVGENIIRALQHDDTVAVLTTVVLSPDGRQQVVTAALDPRMMQQVQRLLHDAQVEREPEMPCVGFHCLVKPKGGRPADEGQDAAPMDPTDPTESD